MNEDDKSGRKKYPQDILEILEMNRYKLLYFLYAFRPVLKDEPGLKSKISKLVGYKSYGHFDTDWNELLHNNLIEERDGMIAITNRTKKIFSFLLALNLIRWISPIISVSLFLYTVSIVLHLRLPFVELNSVYVIFLSAFLLAFITVVSHNVYKTFAPKLPSKREIENSKL